MTTWTRFFFVDVFAHRPLTGNALAVVPDADGLTVGQMQDIAREFNQSETTFLLQPSQPGIDWRLRCFTPIGAEVGGAGHNALGAWLWLTDAGLTGDEPTRRMTQQIGDDVLQVEIVRRPGQPPLVVMDQSPPKFSRIVAADDRLCEALGLGREDLATDRPTQVVSTGTPHLLVAAVDRDAVDRAAPDARSLAAILVEVGGEGCYLYTTARTDPADGTHAYSRFFNPTMGIAEDPATGTAAGPLAVALVHSQHLPNGTPVIIEQGHRIGRPSRIRVDVEGDRVRLSGSGIISGKGQLRLS